MRKWTQKLGALIRTPVLLMLEVQTHMRYEELKGSILTPSIDLAQVGKPPHVSKPNRKANACQQVLDLVVPFGSLLRSRILCFPHPWIMQITPHSPKIEVTVVLTQVLFPHAGSSDLVQISQSEAVLSEWCPELLSLSFIWLSSNGTTASDSRAAAFYWIFFFFFLWWNQVANREWEHTARVI